MNIPLVTIAIPSLNQGCFLNQTLSSVFEQNLPLEVFVMDGGSTDNSLDIIKQWEPQLSGWRSHPDNGQAAAINEGIARGQAPYVCWLNSDDFFLPNSLIKLIKILENHPHIPAVYGRTWNQIQKTGKRKPVWIEPFNERRLALRCIISQPATLIRRSAWEGIQGLDETLHLAMDYDLWWRLYQHNGPLFFVDDYLAVNRDHQDTKTNTQRHRHSQEAIAVVRKYYGRAPLKWWLTKLYSIFFR